MKKAVITSLVCLLLLVVSGLASYANYTPPPGIPGPEEIDFGGKTVTFWTWGYVNQNLSRLHEAEELFNVKIEWEAREPWNALPAELLNRVISGEATHDFIRVQSVVVYWPLAVAGALYPMDNLLTPEYYDSLHPQDRGSAQALEFKGKKHGFGSVYGEWSIMPIVAYYNRTMFEEANLSTPYQLYEEGLWNWDTVTELAVALTKDTTGDGEIDQWGIGWGAHGPVITAAFLAFANEADIITLDEEGYPEFTFDQPAALEVLEQFNQWYELGVIGGDVLWGQNVAMDFGQYIARGAHVYDPERERDLGLVPLPWGPSSVRDVYPVWGYETEALPATVEDPLSMVALHSFVFRPEDGGEFYDYLLGHGGEFAITQQDADVAYTANKKVDARAFLFEGILRNETGFYQAVEDAITGVKTPAQAMAEVKPQIDSLLAELYAD